MSEDIDQGKDAAENELKADAYAEQRNLSQRMSNAKLSALRAQNPFLAIVPFPNSTENVLLPAGVAHDINLPEGTKFISIRATSEYFVSRNGNAQIPVAAVAGMNQETGSCSFDPSQYIYVEEVRQISIISRAADNAVCVSCYQQL